MSFWVNIATFWSLCGVALGGGALLAAQAERFWPASSPNVDRLPKAVWQLCALGLLSCAGFVVCCLGFVKTPQPLFVEALAPNACLAPCLWSLGILGTWVWLLDLKQKRKLYVQAWLSRFLADFAWQALLPKLLILLVLWQSLYCWLPAARPDEAMYHLCLPLQYLLHGGFVVVPGHGNGGFFAFGEMLFFWCLSCGSWAAARAVQLLVLVLGLRAIVGLLPQICRNHTWLGHVWFVLTPVVLWQLPAAYIDVLQVTFELVSLLCWVRWISHEQPQALWAGAWLLGCSAACKHFALANIPFFVLLLLWSWKKRHERLLFVTEFLGRGYAWAGLVACLPVLPYLVRNLWVYHNPLFPFMGSLGQGSAYALRQEQLEVLSGIMGQFGPYNGTQALYGWQALLRLPHDLFFDAAFRKGRFDGVIGFLPLWAIGLAIICYIFYRKNKLPDLAYRWLAAYAGFRVVVWLSISWQARFLIGPVWVACLLVPVMLQWVGSYAVRYVGYVLVGLSVFAALPTLKGHWQELDWRMFGKNTAQQALRQELVPESLLGDKLASFHQPTQVMLIWTQRSALWCPTSLVSDSYDEAATLLAWLEELGANGTHAALQARGITHLLVDEKALFEDPGILTSSEWVWQNKVLNQYKILRKNALEKLDAVQSTVLLAVKN